MSVSFWHESYGTGLRTPGGRKSAFASWQADGQQRSRDLDRAAYYGGDSKFFGGNGYGGGLCEFGYHDIEAGSQCHNGGQYRNNNYGMAFKPCRHRQRQCFYCASKALFFYACAGIDWSDLLYVLQKSKEERHRHDPSFLCHIDVWYGNHVRRSFRAPGCSFLSESVCDVSKSGGRRAGGSRTDGSYPVQFRICGNFTGTGRYRTGYLRGGCSYYYGAEYRDLCDRHDFFRRGK